jgi:hypothetical protein
MGDDLGTLSKEQLTRLAQYFDEAVTSARDYKTYRAEVPHCSEQCRCWAFGIEKGRLTC